MKAIIEYEVKQIITLVPDGVKHEDGHKMVISQCFPIYDAKTLMTNGIDVNEIKKDVEETTKIFKQLFPTIPIE